MFRTSVKASCKPSSSPFMFYVTLFLYKLDNRQHWVKLRLFHFYAITEDSIILKNQTNIPLQKSVIFKFANIHILNYDSRHLYVSQSLRRIVSIN